MTEHIWQDEICTVSDRDGHIVIETGDGWSPFCTPAYAEKIGIRLGDRVRLKVIIETQCRRTL